MAASKYWVLYVGIFVPLFLAILAVVLTLTLQPRSRPQPPRGCKTSQECQNGGTCENGKCKCAPEWTGDRCQTIAVPPAALTRGTAACGLQPVPCATSADCSVCTGTVPFECTELKAEENEKRLEGKYCLPVRPTDACVADPGPNQYKNRVPGVYMWQGWQDVNTQAWTCTCEYPRFYPPAVGGDTPGACTKAPNLCKHGVWHFPCRGKSCKLSDADQRALAGSSPLQNGYCQCDKVPCTSGADCASNQCVNNQCINQRTGLDPHTGLPVCVRDTCAPYGKWVDNGVPPYNYGYCECNADAVDTGYGCVPLTPQPSTQQCVNNCSGHGTCVSGGCLCDSGWAGTDCSKPVCTNDCTGKGPCIGPNTCLCSETEVYDAQLQQCLRKVACAPPPSVDARGSIVNPDNFSNAMQTGCQRGTSAQLDALCQSAGYDRANNALTCFKTADCSGVPCDAEYCGSGVTDIVGPISKVTNADGTGCMNPVFQDVQLRCSQYGFGYGVMLYDTTGQYRCTNFTPTEAVNLGSVKAQAGAGISGSFCIPFASADAAKQQAALDGNGLVAYYTLKNAAGAVVADKQLRLTPVSIPCVGYSYAFSDRFLTIDPVYQLKEGTQLTLEIRTYPQSRYTCTAPNQTFPQCQTLYYSAPVQVELEAPTHTSGITAALNPELMPDAAYELTRRAGWLSTAIQTSSGVNTAVQSVVAATGLTADLKPLVQSPVTVDAQTGEQRWQPAVQVACTAAYCITGRNVTASRFIVIAWKYEPSADAAAVVDACPLLKPPYTLKYNLVRDAPQGGVVSLLSSSSTPAIATVTLVLDDQRTVTEKVAYFIDVVPVQVSRDWTYTLTAFVASTPTTTYETAECKSEEQSFVVNVKPYDKEFCRSVDAPEPNQLPPFAWLDSTGVCMWEPNNKPAIDYYCSIYNTRATTLDTDNLVLADGNYVCRNLGKSWPFFGENQTNWDSLTCDPDHAATPLKYACVASGLPPLSYVMQQTPCLTTNAQGEQELTLTNLDRYSVKTIKFQHAPAKSATYPFFIANFYLKALNTNFVTAVYYKWKVEGGTVTRVDGLSGALDGTLDVKMLNVPMQVCVKVQPTVPNPVFGQNVYVYVEFTGMTGTVATVAFDQVGYTTTLPTSLSGRQCKLTPYGTYITKQECASQCAPPPPDPLTLNMTSAGSTNVRGPGNSYNGFKVVSLGTFTTPHIFAQLVGAPVSISLEHRSGTDEVLASLVLYEGVVSINKDTLQTSEPPYTRKAWTDKILVERKKPGVLNVQELAACTTPNVTYTLVMLLQFVKGKATDDLVYVNFPAIDVVTTSQADKIPAGKCKS